MFTTRKELELAAKAMNNAGYKNVKPEMIQKVKNQWNFDVYVAVVGDAMLVYTPKWNYHNNGGVQFICF